MPMTCDVCGNPMFDESELTCCYGCKTRLLATSNLINNIADADVQSFLLDVFERLDAMQRLREDLKVWEQKWLEKERKRKRKEEQSCE